MHRVFYINIYEQQSLCGSKKVRFVLVFLSKTFVLMPVFLFLFLNLFHSFADYVKTLDCSHVNKRRFSEKLSALPATQSDRFVQ